MRVSLVYIGIIVGTLAVVLAITVFAMRVARWRRDRAMRSHSAPVLVMPLAPDAMAPRPALPREEWSPARAAPASMARISPSSAAAVRITPVENTVVPHDGEPDVVVVPDDDHKTIRTGPFRPGEARQGSPSAHLVQGAQVRF